MDPLSSQSTYQNVLFPVSRENDKRGGMIETKNKTSFIARIFRRNKKQEVETIKVLTKKVTFSTTIQVYSYKPEFSTITSKKVQKAVESLPLLLPPIANYIVIPANNPLWNRITLERDLENRVLGKNVLKRKEQSLSPLLVSELQSYLRNHPQGFDAAVHHMPDLMLKKPDLAISLLKHDFDLDFKGVLDNLKDMAKIHFSEEEKTLLAEYLNVSIDQTSGLSARQKRIALIYNEFGFATSRLGTFKNINVLALLNSTLKVADQNERYSQLSASGLEILNEPILTKEEKAYLSELPAVLNSQPGVSALNSALSQPLDIGRLKTLINIGKELYVAKEGNLENPALLEGTKRRGNLGEKGYFIALSSEFPPKIYITSEVLGVGSSKKVKTALFLNENKLISLSEVNMREIKSKYFSDKERKAKALLKSLEFEREQNKLIAIHAAIVGKAYVIEPNEVLKMQDKPNVMISERYHSPGISEEIIKSPIELKILIMHAWAAGLTQIHAGGFVHSDFKPENTLISGDILHPGPDFKVVITDLGLAVNLETEKIRGGSLLYAAPETRQQTSPRAKPSVDSWSLAISMIELLLPTNKLYVPKEYKPPLSFIMQCKPQTSQKKLDTQFEVLRSLLMRDNPNPQIVNLVMDEAKRLLKIDPDKRELTKVLFNLEKMTLI